MTRCRSFSRYFGTRFAVKGSLSHLRHPVSEAAFGGGAYDPSEATIRFHPDGSRWRRMNAVYPEGGVECVLFAVHIEDGKRIYGSIVGEARM